MSFDDDQKKNKHYTDARAPIIMSITGHTDIKDPNHLKYEISNILKLFKERYPNTDLILMSGMAEGADRIATRCAIEMGIHVGPVFPTRHDVYIRSFQGVGYDGDIEASKKDFESLLADDLTYTPCVLTNEDDNSKHTYRALAAYLISNSHMMIAAWDGRSYNTFGGTYDTMRMAFEGIDNDVHMYATPMSPILSKPRDVQINYLNVEEDCLIYWIPAERTTSKNKLLEKGCLNIDFDPCCNPGFIVSDIMLQDVSEFKYPEKNVKDRIFTALNIYDNDIPVSEDDCNKGDFGKNVTIGKKMDIATNCYTNIPDYYNNIFRKIDLMNHEIQVINSNRNKVNNESHLLQSNYVSTEAIENSGCMKDMSLRYNTTNRMAKTYQSNSFHTMAIAATIGMITGLLFNLFILFTGALVIIALFVIFNYVNKRIYDRHIHEHRYQKFIEYRSLAESLRVGYYWGILGINSSVSAACYGYMKNETLWVRFVMKSWSSHFANDYSTFNCIPADIRLRIVESCWVDGQKTYHNDKKKRNSGLYDNIRIKEQYLAWATIFISSISVICNIFFTKQMNNELFFIAGFNFYDITLFASISITWQIIIKIMLITVSATFGYVLIKKGAIQGGTPLQINSKIKIFDLTEKRLHQNNSRQGDDGIDTSMQIYYELGLLCLNETNDWVFEHKTKDLKPQNYKVNIDAD